MHRGLLLLLLCIPLPALAQLDSTQVLFESFHRNIYQILIIEEASGKRAAIGSGFQIDEQGLVATNFHVISDAVHHPERYRVSYLDHAGRQGMMEIVDFDLIHDLALLRHRGGAQDFLQLADTPLNKGEPLYSLGNPLDLGTSIVSGTYNGLIEKSFYSKILFSGSLNAGMSGGPTLNAAGQVVGINVATAGNQISFLVPVRHLLNLLAQNADALEPGAYRERIGQQLLADQDYKFSLLLDMDWPAQRMGAASIVGEMNQYFTCWGDTRNRDDEAYLMTQTLCTSQDNIFISRDFDTGAIDYQFNWYRSDELNSLQFYRLYQDSLGTMYTRNSASRDDVENYRCHQDFVNAETDASWKTVFCARAYRAYPDLFDVLFISAYLGESDQGLVSHFALSGVSAANAHAFARKFMESYRWP